MYLKPRMNFQQELALHDLVQKDRQHHSKAVKLTGGKNNSILKLKWLTPSTPNFDAIKTMLVSSYRQWEFSHSLHDTFRLIKGCKEFFS